ncbi:MAG: CCA tRNA nucleotidyltransferase [Terracidiphilus sp.]|jgi:tRNA nucleotidyltransferase/poly(A) polymerase
MPDYIYLLENRLSADQQSALHHLREVAREAGTILFLTGDAVRDLTSGHAVRSLEVVVHGNALKLKKAIEKLGGKVWGEDEEARALYLCFPGTVRVDLISAHRVEVPKPGKIVYHPASIQEDLRRRDFTVNAMAISLNEGSFGLLMDPMNGAADIESRSLRLVSNYGFLEEPSLLIRATRYIARLGWEMDPKTHTRYLNAKEEEVIEHLSAQARRRELEQIGHEEEGLKVLRALEAEGWMKVLFPAWTSAQADEEGLTTLHDLVVELLLQGVHADVSAAQMRLLTAKLAARDLTALKKQMLRPGFVEEWNSLDALAAGFAKVLLAKENATPSVSYKLFKSYDPEAVLWLGFTTVGNAGKDAAVRERFNLFLKVWPEVRQRIPHALLQELRITDELPAYREIVETVFLELIDGKLTTPEEARAFLEPHSPPAPPPQVTIKRSRAKRGSEAKVKDDSFDDGDEAEESVDDDEDLDDIGGDDDDLGLVLNLPKIGLGVELTVDSDAGADDDDEDEDDEPKPVAKPAAPVKSAPASASKAEKPQPAPKARPAAALPAKPAPSAAKPVASAASSKSKPAAAKTTAIQSKKPAPAKAPVKSAVKPPVKSSSKAPIKAAQKPATKAKAPAKRPFKAAQKPVAKVVTHKAAPVKKKPILAQSSKAKPAANKPAPKPAKKR